MPIQSHFFFCKADRAMCASPSSAIPWSSVRATDRRQALRAQYTRGAAALRAYSALRLSQHLSPPGPGCFQSSHPAPS